MKYYLSCLRKENYRIIHDRNFTVIGFHENSHLADKLEPGDLIIIYVGSRVSCFSAIVEVKSKMYWDNELIWDDVFPKRVKTTQYLVLNTANWVNVREMIPELSFVKNKYRFGMSFMAGLRNLPFEDGEKIKRRMEQVNGI